MLMKKEIIEDNEKLKDMICDLREQLSKEKQAYINMYNMYDEEKKKNERAIEYIMSNLITEYDIRNNGCVSGSDLPVDAITPILEILKGEDKE